MSFLIRPLSFVALLSLTSCLDVELNTTLNADGSGVIVEETKSPVKVDMGILGSSEASTAEEVTKKQAEKLAKVEGRAEKAGVELISCEVKIDGDYEVERTEIKFTSIEKLNLYFAGDSSDDGEMVVSSLDKGSNIEFSQKYTVIKEMDFQAKAMLGKALEESNLALTWNFSGDIISASENAKISADKRSVTWNTSLLDLLTKGVEVSAIYEKSSSPNYFGMFIIGGVVLLSGGFLVRGMKK